MTVRRHFLLALLISPLLGIFVTKCCTVTTYVREDVHSAIVGVKSDVELIALDLKVAFSTNVNFLSPSDFNTIVSNSIQLINGGALVSTSPFQDPWGNPYAVEFCGYTFPKGIKVIPRKKDGEGALAVWSFGPNGANESGDGDDILVEVHVALDSVTQ